MSKTNDPSKPTRIDVQIGLVFEDQRTGDRRQVIYADERVVLVRDEDDNTTLTRRDAFEADLGTRYRPRPDAEVDVDAGQYARLCDRFAVYERQEGRKARHKADALREALDLLAGDVGDVDGADLDLPEGVSDSGAANPEATDPEESDDTGTEEVSFEAVPGIGPDTAGKLRTAGYVTEADVRGASDDDLLAVSGTGPAALENIREFLD